jgi:hypothetical protein
MNFNAYLFDPAVVHLFYNKGKRFYDNRLPRFGNRSVNLPEHSAQRFVGAFRKVKHPALYLQYLAEVMHGSFSIKDKSAVVEFLKVGTNLVELVIDIADYFFNNIFKSNKACKDAILVYYQGKVYPLFLEVF